MFFCSIYGPPCGPSGPSGQAGSLYGTPQRGGGAALSLSLWHIRQSGAFSSLCPPLFFDRGPVGMVHANARHRAGARISVLSWTHCDWSLFPFWHFFRPGVPVSVSIPLWGKFSSRRDACGIFQRGQNFCPWGKGAQGTPAHAQRDAPVCPKLRRFLRRRPPIFQAIFS